eukprot:scaffold2026_cov82-Isochrysis_galbana.AAC.4
MDLGAGAEGLSDGGVGKWDGAGGGKRVGLWLKWQGARDRGVGMEVGCQVICAARAIRGARALPPGAACTNASPPRHVTGHPNTQPWPRHAY